VTCSCSSHNGFLTAKGLAEAAQRERELTLFPEMGLARGRPAWYLDKVGSVSALVEVEGATWPCDEVIDEQHRRFLSGS